MEAIFSAKRRFLQEPHGVTPQTKIFFTDLQQFKNSYSDETPINLTEI
jgi:hypothetical protein